MQKESLEYTQCMWCMQNGGKPNCKRPEEEVVKTLPRCLSGSDAAKLGSLDVDTKEWEEEYELHKLAPNEEVEGQIREDLAPASGGDGAGGQDGGEGSGGSGDESQVDVLDCSVYWALKMCVDADRQVDDSVVKAFRRDLEGKLPGIEDYVEAYVAQGDIWDDGDCQCYGEVGRVAKRRQRQRRRQGAVGSRRFAPRARRVSVHRAAALKRFGAAAVSCLGPVAPVCFGPAALIE